MEAAGQRLSQIVSRSQGFVASIWYALRHPRTTGLLLVVLIMVTLLGVFIPQQTGAVPPARTDWVSSLPGWLQPTGDILFLFGLAQIFQSLWFWLPVALLLLHSLVALADYAPGSWRRLSRLAPPLDWQHPLACRVENSARLPGLPDDFIDNLKQRLQKDGFTIYAPVESKQRFVGAARRRWAWLGVTAFYLGLIGVIGGFLITHYTLATDRFTLLPLRPHSSSLFKGDFILADAPTSPGASQVIYTPSGEEQFPQPLTWRLFWPILWQNTFILPVAVEPILIVEMRDAANMPVKLFPLQEDLPPVERLSMPLTDPSAPLYFTIPAADLAVQVLADPTAGEVFNVQARRGVATPLVNANVPAGQVFQIDKYTGTLRVSHSLTVVARRDPAWPLYFLSGLLILAGLILTFVWPPILVWLIPEVKGLGGQLYGVLETFGPEARPSRFLEDLLSAETQE